MDMADELITDDKLAGLEDRLRGRLLRPQDSEYDRTRRLWNARIDRRPAAIAVCTGAADVMASVSAAAANDWSLSVKGGGHHVSGAAVCDGGLMLDLSAMDGVRVDQNARRAQVQGGALWGDVDHETQAFGLAVPGSQDPTVGVAGLTLGGGVGWLSSTYGLTCDNLRSADVVTADGELIHASEDSNADLFWALRGGGGGFGVVTSFEYNLHPVGTEVLAGSLIYRRDAAREVLRQYRAFIEDAPPEVRPLIGIMELPAAEYYPPEVHHERVLILILCYCGDPVHGRAILDPLREVGSPVMDSIRARSYLRWQQVGESSAPMRTAMRSHFLETLSDDAIDVILRYGFDAPDADATVFISPRRRAEVDPATEGAYPHRTESHHVLVESRWEGPTGDDVHDEWVRAFHDAIQPWAGNGVAVNFLPRTESDRRIRAAFGDNLDRLQEVKRTWDPENLFRMSTRFPFEP